MLAHAQDQTRKTTTRRGSGHQTCFSLHHSLPVDVDVSAASEDDRLTILISVQTPLFEEFVAPTASDII
jgi:hypothetical protein